MSEPFLAEIKLVSFDFAPKRWATCDGQILAIAQNQALFSLLGTTFGGNGVTTFALPNLQGRTAVHFSNAIDMGDSDGAVTHSLTSLQIPAHTHPVHVNANPGTSSDPSSATFAQSATGLGSVYGSTTNLVEADFQMVSSFGGAGTAHNNMQPYLSLNFIISLQGIFPSRN